SRYEGFPNALAEAMAVGLPAVAFENVSGVEELVISGRTGILVCHDQERNEGEKLTFSDALQQLMTSAELRTQIGT
ncbi:glycosyltransferase, partial [Klebsiella pneumoniae]|nr:glycosyltransferase [Klebsiella pneumoniae]